MRLDFNIVLIDDDKDDSQRNRGVNKLKQLLEDHIRRKGFKPIVRFEKSSLPILSLNESDKKRIDLYLSDNNLSNNSHERNVNEEDGGIELYLSLKDLFICEFILYSRSDKSTIIKKLIEDLNEKQNPNLFTRFSFVERNSTNEEWIKDVLRIVDHIITKREELNNLRGIFAQVMSRVHHKMVERYRVPTPESSALADTIKYAFDKNKINQADYTELLSLKNIRNGLLHNDEFICPTRSVRCIKYLKVSYSHLRRETTENEDFIYEDESFEPYRRRLNTLFERFR
ncbi:hypothetical protein PYR78_11315 [Acinetobacter johnsonii]|nr:hypothetical protein PYR78_11315 [Acinetobacter johnsonii]